MIPSDSESSSSRSSPLSRRGSLQPLQMPDIPPLDGPQTEEDLRPSLSRSVSKAAGSGAVQVKLTLTKDAEEGVDEDASLTSAMLDIVVIPGLYGSGKELADEASNNWARTYLQSFAPGSSLKVFDWDVSHVFAGHQTRESIQIQAQQLLYGLSDGSGEKSLRRSIMFVADDLGSIVLKQALTMAATSNVTSWLDIVDRTRALVFRGCPHRSTDQREMEDKLAEFVLGGKLATVSLTPKPTLAAISGLAEAVIQINGLFILTKIQVKCHLLSIHHGGRYASGQMIGVFDEFVGTLGLPFERRILAETSGQGQLSPILQHLEDWNIELIWPDAEDAERLASLYERILMSMSSSISTFRTPLIEEWSLPTTRGQDAQNFIEWCDAHTTDILYVNGDVDIEETSEQLFYVLDQQRKRGCGDGQVLYFSFEKHDKKRNTLKDMLATFIAQMICHNSHEMSFIGQSMFVQFSEEGGWTDQDLLQWFSQCSDYLFTDSAYLVIHGFDECSEAGCMSFMEWLDQTTTATETLWKVAVTSRQRLDLDPEAELTKCSRQVSMVGSQHNSSLRSIQSKELKNLVLRSRPELILKDELLRSTDTRSLAIDSLSINSIRGGDTLIQEITLAHLLSIPEWPVMKSLDDVFGPMTDHSSNEEILTSFLNNVFRKLPPAYNIRTLLLWLLYSARPLSLWELASVTWPNSPNVSPRPDVVREFRRICETSLRGIVDIRDTQVRLRHPRLREVLIKSIESSDTYIWNDIDASEVNQEITKTCLEFLTKHDAQRELESLAQTTILSETAYGPSLSHTDFCAYAAYYWPRHAVLIQNSSETTALLEQYKQSALTSTWMKSFWCLSNPITRSRQPSESLDALLHSCRLPNATVETRNLRSIQFAAREAAARGYTSSVMELLPRCEQSKPVLIDILKAAASSGKEELALYVFEYIRDVTSNNEAMLWPPCLLYRAAWMGMNQFAGELLDAGCSADPGGPMTEKSRLSPLHLAVRHAHTNTVARLLSHGADAGLLTRWNRSVLFTATCSGRPEVFQILFELGRLNLTDTDEFDITPLHYAASCGRKAAVQSLLRMGADPHDRNDLASSNIGWLPLVDAASKGHTESVRTLLDHDADPNQPGPQRVNTALYYAAVNNFPYTLHVLLKRGADPNHPLLKVPLLAALARSSDTPAAEKTRIMDILIEFKAKIDAADDQGHTALMFAIKVGDESVVAHLLKLGASVDTEDDEKRSPLHLAATCGSEAILKLILSKVPDLDHLDYMGRAALSYCVASANMAGILLENGAKPDLTEFKGYIPLMFAARGGHSETVKLLLKHHAKVNLRTESEDGTGYTAVYFAARSDYPEIVKILADAGADLKYKYTGGETALHVASFGVAGILLQYRKRLNINEKDDNGWTALHKAIYYRNLDLVKLLVNSGADLNVRDDDGDTPLATAAWSSDHEVLKILLQEEDCDPRSSSGSYRGNSPLHWAVMNFETMEIVRLLVERGADVNLTAKGAAGSPLQQACRNKQKGKEMIDYLLEKGADLNAQGGTLGFVISSAALYGTLDMISMLLQRGATVNVADAMGRKPIHMACAGGAENFQEIYKAGGNKHLEDKDNLGRTVFHYAAQHGRPEILEMLIAELGTDLLDKPDVDGWTPLMWTCLPRLKTSGSEKDVDGSRKRRLRVFQILLNQGAQPGVIGKIEESSWSLRDLMIYNDIDKQCLQLVDKALMLDGPPVPSATTDASQGRKIGALQEENDCQCDACFCSIRDLIHICSECYMNLCNKCHWHTDLVHNLTCECTQWETFGHEFEEDKALIEPPSEERAAEGVVDASEEDDDSDTVWSEDTASSSD